MKERKKLIQKRRRSPAVDRKTNTKISVPAGDETFLRVLQALPDIVYRIDPKGIFTFLNDLVDTLGYKPKDLIGKHFSTIVHPDDVKRFARKYVLPKYRGKVTGVQHAPKLFDERRTGRRKTRGLEIRLLHKGKRGKRKVIYAEVIALGDISATGYYRPPTPGKTKKFLGTIGIIRDITLKKQAEMKLHYQADMLKHVSDAIISTDLNFNIRTWNYGAEKMYGWKFYEVEGKKVAAVTKLKYPNNKKSLVIKQFLQKGYWKGEVIQSTKKGEPIYVQVSVVMMKDAQGNPIGAVAVNRDISEVKKAEMELQYSEEKFRGIFNVAPDGIITVDLKGNITDINNFFSKITGYTKKEIIGIHISKLPTARAKDIPDYLRIFKSLLLGKIPKPFEFQWIHKNGTVYWGEVRVSVLKKNKRTIGFQAITRDISRQKQLNESLVRSEQKYRSVVENLNEGIWVMDHNGITTYVNDRMAKILGYSRNEMMGRSIFAFMDDKGRAFALNRMALRRQGISRNFAFEFEFLHKERKRVFTRMKTSVLRDNQGKYHSTIAAVEDITEQKQIQKALKESEEKYSTLVEKSMDAIVVHENGIIKFVNKRACDMTGIPERDFIGKNIMDFIVPEYQQLVAQRFTARLRRENVPSIYEIGIKKRDGTYLPVEINATIVNFEDSPAALVIIRDISQRKKTQAKIEQRNYQLAVLNKINAVISQSLDLDTILTSTLKEILKIMNLDIGGIYLADPEEKKIRLAVHQGVSEDYARAVSEISVDNNTLKKIRKILNNGQYFFSSAFVLTNLRKLPGFMRALKKEKLNINSFHNIALYTKKRIIGLLVVGSKIPRVLSPDDKDLLISISRQVSIAVLNSQLFIKSRSDLADRIEADKSIYKSLLEKEALLREIHHRVKNNLQIISSLLNLQVAQIKDEYYKGLFKESQNRIRSMVLVHEKLYQAKNISDVEISTYLESLIQHLFQTYGIKPEAMELSFDVKDIKLNIDVAIPCGLIINELLSNALKYAFKDSPRQKPKIGIKMTKKNNFMQLTVFDNGIGLPDDITIGSAKTLGLQLVHALVEQLNGKITIDRENGTSYSIEFRFVCRR